MVHLEKGREMHDLQVRLPWKVMQVMHDEKLWKRWKAAKFVNS